MRCSNCPAALPPIFWRPWFALFIAASLLGGCSLWPFESGEPRALWRDQAEDACLTRGLVKPSRHIQRAGRIKGPGACGANRPFKVHAFQAGAVRTSTPAVLACPIIPVIETWLAEDVQPAARSLYGVAVVEVEVVGSYACRTRNHRRNAPLSEHAFANAIDIAGFKLADGRQVELPNGWTSPDRDAVFLRTVHGAACKRFTTVIGPDGDAYHRNHFHLDRARHNKDNSYVHCE